MLTFGAREYLELMHDSAPALAQSDRVPDKRSGSGRGRPARHRTARGSAASVRQNDSADLRYAAERFTRQADEVTLTQTLFRCRDVVSRRGHTQLHDLRGMRRVMDGHRGPRPLVSNDTRDADPRTAS